MALVLSLEVLHTALVIDKIIVLMVSDCIHAVVVVSISFCYEMTYLSAFALKIQQQKKTPKAQMHRLHQLRLKK